MHLFYSLLDEGGSIACVDRKIYRLHSKVKITIYDTDLRELQTINLHENNSMITIDSIEGSQVKKKLFAL